MPYDNLTWKRSAGWKVEDVYDSRWGLQGSGSPNPDTLTFHGDGKGPTKTDDLLKKNGGSLATDCLHANTKEEVEVDFRGTTYVIRLDTSSTPKMLTCVEKGLSSGNASWTAVEGG